MKIYNPDIQNIGIPEQSSVNSHIFTLTPEMFLGTATSRINQAIDAANAMTYGGTVVCNGTYFLDTAILMKSNVILINNGLIKMNTGMRDNMVRAASLVVGTPITNFKIIGRGIFQGSSDTWGGDSVGWIGIGILLANCTNFQLDGFTVKNPHMWSINLEQCRYGSVKNIFFDCDGSKTNQDGLNIRHGSHHILVDSLLGVTQDDTLAITNFLFGNAVNYLGQTIYETGKSNFDMFSIVVKNMNRSKSAGVIGSYIPAVQKGGITIICNDGLKIYNVSIDGVNGNAQIYIQFSQIQYWVNTQATVDDVYNISIYNTGDAPVYLGRAIKNSSFINIPNKDSTGVYDSCVFQTGSLNVTRKYHSANFEFFATV
jgi:polygalacturonase